MPDANKAVRLVARRHSPWARRSFVVGASIGAGSAALAVKQGGADFLLVGNVGRLRMMGAPSCACHMPLRDSNRLVAEFARSEILPMVDLPVFFGAAACDAEIDVRALPRAVRDWGFDGICNFPTSSEMSGPFREVLEASGRGFGREVEMLGHGKDAGLSVLAYVRDLDDIGPLVEIGADIICILFSPSFRMLADPRPSDLEITAGLMRPVIAMIRKRSPNTLCLFGGAAVSNPERMLQLCDLMRADGYIGGSIIDQLPLQRSIEDRVAEFKAVSTLRQSVEATEKETRVLGKRFHLAAGSESSRKLYARIARAARQSNGMIIIGEIGTGKTHMCECIHQLSRRRAQRLTRLVCDPDQAESLGIELFGAVAGTFGLPRNRIGLLATLAGCTLVLESLENIPLVLQRRLFEVMESKRTTMFGGHETFPADIRLIFTARRTLDELLNRSLLLPELDLLLRPFSFELPPLRERIEDLPFLIEAMLPDVRRRINPRITAIEHAALRYLQHQPWPGNLRMLRSVIEEAAFRAPAAQIRLADLDPVPTARMPATSERERIIDALWRCNFRKGETADFLRVTRKTLYNRMKKYKLLSAQSGSAVKHDQPGY